jgi:AcrR family transcriptional regulator
MRTRNLEKEAAIKTVALQLIADEGLENLTMQRLAEAAKISPRTIYLKYENKEDLLIKLFIDEVLGPYEAHALANFDPRLPLAEGLKRIWMNVFTYLTANRPAFALLQYGKSSPLLNKAFKERNIKEGDYFGPIHRFIKYQIQQGVIRNLPVDIYRAILFSPLLDLVGEYFDHLDRPKQIITPKALEQCLEILINGIAL